MAIDTTIILRNIIRVGRVSSVDTQNNTAKVYYPDRDNMISDNLHIINRASQNDKDYWVPDVDEQVLCLILPNAGGNGMQEGFILGSFYSTTNAPVVNSADKRAIHFKDGGHIIHDRSTGNFDIHATGNINIKAAGEIKINGEVIKLNC